jgi:diguanylate cyclase
MDEGDLFTFADETDEEEVKPTSSWLILIVDDDEEVHKATLFSLQNTQILGRSLSFIHAYSAKESEQKLLKNPDIAVILLDVVMETEDAGLKLIDAIRNKLSYQSVRIILRTGQPGYAPELEVIAKYDINDYLTKSDVTQTRFISCLTSSVRSYCQLQTISDSKKGLKLVVDATSDLMTRKGIVNFANGVMSQISALLEISEDSLIVAEIKNKHDERKEFKVLVAGGVFSNWLDMSVEHLPNQKIGQLILKAMTQGENVSVADCCSVLVFAGSKYSMAAYVSPEQILGQTEQNILQLFSRNIALCSDNLLLIENLHEFAYIDKLTQLPNRNHFLEEAKLRFDDGDNVLVIVDIDHFNSVVDIIGHKNCELLLQKITKKFVSTYQDLPVYISRVGGDIFALIGREADIQPQSIQSVMTDSIQIDELNIPMSYSIGVVRMDASIGDYMKVISGGYAALKKAKQQEMSGFVWCTPTMTGEIHARERLLLELRDGVESNELFLNFQPQMDLTNNSLMGFEALCRWKKSDGSFVPPDEFIPIAESSGLIISLGTYVLQTACQVVSELRQRGYVGVIMAVNVSIAQLRMGNFTSILEEVIADYNIPADCLKIEITESIAMQDINQTIRYIDQMKAIGVKISKDDFGTGFSSLSYLQRLNIDQLKIDRSFVIDLEDSEQSRNIAETIVKLGQQLNLEVIAEGVETEAQLFRLREMGCDSIQGYYYSKPMPIAELIQWLENEKRA